MYQRTHSLPLSLTLSLSVLAALSSCAPPDGVYPAWNLCELSAEVDALVQAETTAWGEPLHLDPATVGQAPASLPVSLTLQAVEFGAIPADTATVYAPGPEAEDQIDFGPHDASTAPGAAFVFLNKSALGDWHIVLSGYHWREGGKVFHARRFPEGISEAEFFSQVQQGRDGAGCP